MRCLECENDKLFSGMLDGVQYVLCTCCHWYKPKEDYYNMVNEALEKALEEI